MYTLLLLALIAFTQAQNTIKQQLSATPGFTAVEPLFAADSTSNTWISGQTAYTLFAPTDTGVQNFGTANIPADTAVLNPILQAHFLTGDFNLTAVGTVIGDTLTTSANTVLRAVQYGSGDVFVCAASCAQVTEADVGAPLANGALHAIDNILLPLAADATLPKAAMDANLTTLAAAVGAADLWDALNNTASPVTVLAPTDAAFAALPEAVVPCLLLAGNKQNLANVLLNHVFAAEAAGAQQSVFPAGYIIDAVTTAGAAVELDTLASEKLSVNVVNNMVTVGAATVAVADVFTNNGVVHVVDAVLVPAADQLGACGKDIKAVANDAGLTTLATAIDGDATLKTATELLTKVLTVMAPTNDAIDATSLTVDANVLAAHVVDGTLVTEPSQVEDKVVETVAGSFFRVVKGADDVYRVCAKNCAKITATAGAYNGFAHVIDDVLETIEKNVTFASIVSGSSVHKTLLTALTTEADLLAGLDTDSPLTLFAPTDAAFEKLGDTVACLLEPKNKASLTKLLKAHLVSSSVFSFALTDGAKPAALSGDMLTVGVGNSVTVTLGQVTATVTGANLHSSNGVIHVVDEVIIPAGFSPDCTKEEPMTPTEKPTTGSSALAAHFLLACVALVGFFL